jgi:simple sugar transport system permease protein
MLVNFLQSAILISIFASTIRIATPVLLAALGELVAEKSGILNMGVEGMMLSGAFTGFYVAYQTGSLCLGIVFECWRKYELLMESWE